ncbi:MAG: DUF3226 domain-containing protein [Candidatus Methylomirabilis sp.]
MANRIIVEGRDDRHVVRNLLYHHQLHEMFDFKDKDGIEKLLDTLEEEIQATDVERLGIIIDADLDLSRQWARMTGILIRCGYDAVPSAPDPAGTIVAGENGQRIGIWIMPNNVLKGAVEDFVGHLIADGDGLWPRAQESVNGIPEVERRFKPTYVSKAQIHTWLAWQEEPGTRMGEAFTKRYLDPTRPQAQAFIGWIRKLLA